MGTLASLVSRIISLGLPRASNHLFAVGQLLSDASQDQALAATLTGACITYTQSGGEAPCCRVDESLSPFRSFASFLAAHVSSLSLLDQVKSDVIYVTLELLDCILATGTKAGLGMAQARSKDTIAVLALAFHRKHILPSNITMRANISTSHMWSSS